MQTLGKTLRNCVPALGLGLISVAGLAGVAVVAPPSAMAQNKASKEFVDNIGAANTAFGARKYADAIAKADAAAPHASGTAQKAAVEQIRAGAYCAMNNYAQCISAIEKARAVGGVPAAVNQNYDKQLVTAYEKTGQAGKATAQLKSNITKYGGTADELAVAAKNELAAKNYGDAVKFAQQSISKGSSKKVPYNILLNAYDAQGKKEDFYKTLEKAAPIFKSDEYWKPFIEKTKSEKSYRSGEVSVDVYRAMDAAGVKLSDADKFDWGKQALNRGYAIEAERVWVPLFKSGAYGGANDKSKDSNLRSFATAQADAKKDKEGKMAQNETVAAAAPSGENFANVGDTYLGAQNYAKAIELFQKAIAKGQLDAGKVDLIKLRLGIAQFKGGKKADALKTWATVKSDNGSAWLARVWTAIAKM